MNTNMKLMKILFKKFLYLDHSFHYLIEPELIIRTGNKNSIDSIRKYLENHKVYYSIYDWPYPKKGYGEGKGEITVKYQNVLLPIYNLLSKLALKAPYKDYLKVYERISHCMLNMGFYEWEEELTINLRNAYYRSKLIINQDIKRLDREL